MDVLKQIKAYIEDRQKELRACSCDEEVFTKKHRREMLVAYEELSRLLVKLPAIQKESANDELEADEDLDKEINRWMGCTDCLPEGVGITPLPKAMEIVNRTARHFAEWQKKQDEDDMALKYFYGLDEGGKIVKEAMMKNVVEGAVVKNQNNTLKVVSAPIDDERFRFGDSVKLIILPKED